MFAILNFVFAGLCALWLALMIAVLVYGIGFSGDEGMELVKGIAGCVIAAAPGCAGLGVYLAAGMGLLRRRKWGYYCHCAGAVLMACTCLGLVYTVAALVFAVQPEFSAAFFPFRGPEVAYRTPE